MASARKLHTCEIYVWYENCSKCNGNVKCSVIAVSETYSLHNDRSFSVQINHRPTKLRYSIAMKHLIICLEQKNKNEKKYE